MEIADNNQKHFRKINKNVLGVKIIVIDIQR